MRHRRAFQTWTGSEDGEPKKPLLSLRIFAENNPRRFFAEVYVWEFLYQVRALKASHARRTLAFWHEFQEPEKKEKPDSLGRPVISRKLGEMHLCLPSCTYNTIAHEAYHATRTFARRSGNIEAGTLAEAAKERVWQGMAEEVNASFQGLLTDKITAAVLRLVNSRERQTCGEATHMRDGPDDDGKFRTCERIKGHTGKHMTHYCGKRRYWQKCGHDKSVITVK